MRVGVFDYEVGNIHSLRRALERALAASATGDGDADQVLVTSDLETFLACDVLVLPGVGHFGHVMERLAPATKAIRDRVQSGAPLLGICIGMQVLFESSAEAPGEAGLGLLPGHVERIPAGAGRKVPHMGWNDVDGIGCVYYVHSYAVGAQGSESTLDPRAIQTRATTYGDYAFLATVEEGPIVGYQFHPEKSSDVGHEVLTRTFQRFRRHLQQESTP